MRIGRQRRRRRKKESRRREREEPKGIRAGSIVGGEGQDKKEGDRETGGGRPKKISIRMDAERTGRKTRKNLEKRSEQGLQKKGERMKEG